MTTPFERRLAKLEATTQPQTGNCRLFYLWSETSPAERADTLAEAERFQRAGGRSLTVEFVKPTTHQDAIGGER